MRDEQLHLKEGVLGRNLGSQGNHVHEVSHHALQLRAPSPVGCRPHDYIVLLCPPGQDSLRKPHLCQGGPG